MEALVALLQSLAADTGMAYVLLPQAGGSGENATRDILSKATRMPVLAADGKLALKANHVYAIPSDSNMMLRGGVLRLADRQEVDSRQLSIDRFLDSLAEDRKSAAIGIMASRTAPDGIQGLKAIRAAGGLTFADEETLAEHVDFVLPPPAWRRSSTESVASGGG